MRYTGPRGPRVDGSCPPSRGPHREREARGARPLDDVREQLRRARRRPGGRERSNRKATRSHTVVAACNPWSGCPLRIEMMISGDLKCMEGPLCICRWQPGSTPDRRIEHVRRCRLFLDEGRQRSEAQSSPASKPFLLSWRFERPDISDLESHSVCRASGWDGRDFRPPHVTPRAVVLHLALRLRIATRTWCASRICPSFGNRFGDQEEVVLRCGNRRHPIYALASLSWSVDLPHVPCKTMVLLSLRFPAPAG